MSDLTMRDIMAMLKDSGSIMISQKNHYKFELPNGRLFMCPKTPSDYRGVKNLLSALRKELRLTHPAIADRGRNLRKKVALTSTIGDLIRSKEESISAYSAIPGSQPVPEKEIEFEIIDKPIEVQAEETPIHAIPRKSRGEEKPKPTSYRSLTAEQMAEANRILREQGDAAMSAYMSQCKTEEHAVERRRAVQPIPNMIEGDPMTELLQRARVELEATNKRIENYDQQIAVLKAQQETDILRQTQIEEYITKHEALALEAEQILQFLPPAPVQTQKTVTAAHVKYWASGFGMKDVREQIFPLLGDKEFTPQDVVQIAQRLKMPEPVPYPSKVKSWFVADSLRRETGTLDRLGPNKFRLRQTAATAVFIPAQDAQVAHA